MLVMDRKSIIISVVMMYYPFSIPLRQIEAASSGDILVDCPSISQVTLGFNLFSSISPGVSIVEGVNRWILTPLDSNSCLIASARPF